jgi:hypothetical protein
MLLGLICPIPRIRASHLSAQPKTAHSIFRYPRVNLQPINHLVRPRYLRPSTRCKSDSDCTHE